MRSLVRRREIEGISRREAEGVSEEKIRLGRATKKSPDITPSLRVAARPAHFFFALLRQLVSFELPASRSSK
jgi:hypothetical protein